MAHKKGAGSSDNGRDSNPQYLGVKMFGGQAAIPGNILVRQRGTKFHPGVGVYMGKDHTLHASISGIVTFKKGKDEKRVVYITPFPEGSDAALQTAHLDAKSARKTRVSGTGASFTSDEVKAAREERVAAARAAAAKPAAVKPAKVVKETVVSAPVVAKTVVSAPVVETVVSAPTVTRTVITPSTTSSSATTTRTTTTRTIVSGGSSTTTTVTSAAEPVVTEAVTVTPVVPTVTTTTVVSEVVAQEATETVAQTVTGDDLKLIEGIGPKIAELFYAAGITTFAQLSETSTARMQEILDGGGPRYSTHNPMTWGHQASLAAEGQWDELKELQDELNGGKA